MTDATKVGRPADPRVLATIDSHPARAELRNVDGQWVLTMARTLPAPPERVWRKLTEPAELATWSPIVPDRPLTIVGPARGHEEPADEGFDAEVLVADPPRELVHRWGSQLVRWTIEPTETGSRLTLEHTFDALPEHTSYAAGWHIVLAVLEAGLSGASPERVTGERAIDYGWPALRDRYETALAPDAAVGPDAALGTEAAR